LVQAGRFDVSFSLAMITLLESARVYCLLSDAERSDYELFLSPVAAVQAVRTGTTAAAPAERFYKQRENGAGLKPKPQ